MCEEEEEEEEVELLVQMSALALSNDERRSMDRVWEVFDGTGEQGNGKLVHWKVEAGY